MVAADRDDDMCVIAGGATKGCLGRDGDEACEQRKSYSFLKKRTKKLLFLSGSTGGPYVGQNLGARSKSFLVLFFKKELFFPFFS
jgi:hypothetical protein